MLIMHEMLTGEVAASSGPLPFNAGETLPTTPPDYWWPGRFGDSSLDRLQRIWEVLRTGAAMRSDRTDRHDASALRGLVRRSGGAIQEHDGAFRFVRGRPTLKEPT